MHEKSCGHFSKRLIWYWSVLSNFHCLKYSFLFLLYSVIFTHVSFCTHIVYKTDGALLYSFDFEWHR